MEYNKNISFCIGDNVTALITIHIMALRFIKQSQIFLFSTIFRLSIRGEGNYIESLEKLYRP